jgi:hypothetical protein
MSDVIQFHKRQGALSDGDLNTIRDMIIVALDATEKENLPEQNRIKARAALAEALEVLDGGEVTA